MPILFIGNFLQILVANPCGDFNHSEDNAIPRNFILGSSVEVGDGFTLVECSEGESGNVFSNDLLDLSTESIAVTDSSFEDRFGNLLFVLPHESENK